MKKRLSAILSVMLSLVFALSCFSINTLAAGVTIVKQPTHRTFYQGIDWTYIKDGSISTLKNLNMEGTVLNYNSKDYSYSVGKFGPTIYAKSLSGKWNVGSNQIKVYSDYIPSSAGYATTTVNFVAVKSAKLVKRPDKTILVQDEDWKLGYFNDVEITSFDVKGAIIEATYTDGTTSLIKADDTMVVGGAVPQEVENFYPGPQTIYVTCCGYKFPYEAFFASDTVHSKGDVNMDNKITSYDALLVLQNSIGTLTLTSAQNNLAEVSGDGNVNSTDALFILQYVVGAKSTLN